MSTLHLFDCSAIARSFIPFASGGLTARVRGNVIETTFMYPVLNTLRARDVDLMRDDVVFCFDRPSKRKFLMDSYKQNRITMPNSYYEQLRRTEEFLEDLGYNVLYRDGYEADDIIAMCVNKYKDSYDSICIHTNDSDLAGLIDSQGKTYLALVPKYRGLVTKDNFEFVLKIPFNSLYLYKATVGDSSDNIKGIVGFGNKAFEKMMEAVRQVYDVELIAEKNYEEEIIKWYFATDENAMIAALSSLELVKPNLDIIDEIKINRLSEGYSYNILATVKLLEAYEMKSIAKSLTQRYL